MRLETSTLIAPTHVVGNFMLNSLDVRATKENGFTEFRQV